MTPVPYHKLSVGKWEWAAEMDTFSDRLDDNYEAYVINYNEISTVTYFIDKFAQSTLVL